MVVFMLGFESVWLSSVVSNMIHICVRFHVISVMFVHTYDL